MRRVHLPKCECCSQPIRQDYVVFADGTAWHDDCVEELATEHNAALRARRMERYLAEFRPDLAEPAEEDSVEPAAPSGESLPVPNGNGSGIERETPEQTAPVILRIVSPEVEPAEDAPAETGESGAPETGMGVPKPEPPVPMKQCPDCPEGHLLPVTREHFVLKTDGKSPAFARCKPHHNALQRRKRAEQGASSAAPEPEPQAEFSRENPEAHTEAHGEPAGDYVIDTKTGEKFRLGGERAEPPSASREVIPPNANDVPNPTEPLRESIRCEEGEAEAAPAEPARRNGRKPKYEPEAVEGDGLRLSPEECKRRREALGLSHDELARAIDYLIGYGAIDNFEKGISLISGRAAAALDEALSWMEANGVPAELRGFVDAITAEQRMARVP